MKLTRRQFWTALLAPLIAFFACFAPKKSYGQGINPKYFKTVKLDSGLVGYKGKTVLDAGYFYCPYIPLQMMPGGEALKYKPSMLVKFKTRYGSVNRRIEA